MTTKKEQTKPELPPLKIEYVKIKDLKLAEYNPKKFNSSAFKNLGTSISEYGFLAPIIVSKRTGNVIDGNQRLKNEIKKGDAEREVPLVYLDIDMEMEKKLNIAFEQTRTTGDADLTVALLRSLSTQDELTRTILESFEKKLKDGGAAFSPEMNIVVEADESYDYLLFLSSKSIDFLTVCNFFNVENVYDMNREKSVGLGRAIHVDVLIKLIDYARKNNVINAKDL